MTVIYGINNCDTVKKALKWLEKNNIPYTFHDFKKQGLTSDLLEQFAEQSSWAELVNKRSTTFRNLPQEIKDNLNHDNCFNACMEQPTLIKRPVLVHNQALYLGFKDASYQEIFGCE